MVKAKAELEQTEADIAARLAKVQAELNKMRVKAQAKVDKAVAEAEKAKAEVRARENHREVSKRYSERMSDQLLYAAKRKLEEVTLGGRCVRNRSHARRSRSLKHNSTGLRRPWIGIK